MTMNLSDADPNDRVKTPLRYWLDRRGVLNHDILCNQLRNELSALRIEPELSNPIRLQMWLHHELEYREFFEDAFSVFSPSYLMDSPLFAQWPARDRDLFRKVFHELYILTSELPAKVQRLQELLSESIVRINGFLATTSRFRTSTAVEEIIEALECLSEEISSLPDRAGCI